MEITDTMLQAGFMAARAHGKLLNDEILRDILIAMIEAGKETE